MATIELEVPEGLDPELVKQHFQNQLGYRASVRELSEVLASSEQAISPAAAASMASVEQFWRDLIEKYGVYSAADIAILRGANPKNRSVAANFAKRQKVVGFQRGRAKVYPRFQFLDSEVHPDWKRLSAPLFEAGWPEKPILYWACSPSGYLDQRAPADAIGTDDIDAAVDAAQDYVKGFVT